MMAKSSPGAFGFAAALLVVLPASQAWADAIDGDWCAVDGRRMAIHGADLVTPAGTTMKGNYSRHYFSYVVPPTEPGAGQTVSMILLNENTVNLRVGADAAASAQAPVEIWHRCAPTTSDRGATPRPRL
jgi:hypothetical protein